MHIHNHRQYFIPRDAFFWLAHFAGWLFFLAPTLSVGLVKHSYDTQLLVADLTRFLLSLPVLLLFRYFYNRFDWYMKHPFELLSLMVGYNLLTAWAVAWCVQSNVWLTHEWLTWFSADFRVTTRDPDEMQISWLSSLVVQLAWCFIYVVVKSNGRNQSNELERIRIQNQLKDAKINTLMGQISPHFLFNGMNNIINLMDEDIPRAQKSLRAFSDMLRFSLASPNQERVSLQEELNLVRNYLAIAEIHLEDKLRFSLHVTETARHLQVPPMLLQMLVENAIKHGISLQKNGGELQIVIDDSGEDLICLVSNDGILNPGHHQQKKSGVGIENVRQRLALLYGDAARLDLMQEGEKVVAEVHIPRSLCQ